ncbi:MAG: acyl-CoA/acyl-ACP dehydrogenase [Gammaproteobacteria bacterium]|nr:acyl-CoA/acyl-ACP dehydrogenase [Gammaproteobacteria bacterium]
MDFNFSEQQREIQDSMERIFADLCSDEHIKRVAPASGSVLHDQLWRELAAAGIFGLPFDERFGGLELGLVELCLILELQGRSVAPVPLLSSVVECAMTIADGDNEALQQTVLPGVISGEVILSPVSTYHGIQREQQHSALAAIRHNDGYRLTGRSGFAPWVGAAKGYVVSLSAGSDAESDAGSDVNVVAFIEAGHSGIEVVEQQAISGEPAGYLRFDNCVIEPQQIIADGEAAQRLQQSQQHRRWIGLAALQVGVLDAGLKRTAAYVSERKQFGRALGSFQAVSQQAANAYMEIESLRSAYWRALDDVQADTDLSMSASVAAYWVAQAGHLAAHTELHLHGGIGQDLDYPIHRYFLWAKQCERYAGNRTQCSLNIGRQLMSADAKQLEQLCL